MNSTRRAAGPELPAGDGQPPTAEQIARLARAIEDAGLGPAFCRWQRQDTEVWDLVAADMEAHAADGAR